MRLFSLLVTLAVVINVEALPGASAKHCSSSDRVIEALEGCEKSKAAQFCSAYLHLPEATKHVTKTISITSTRTTSKAKSTKVIVSTKYVLHNCEGATLTNTRTISTSKTVVVSTKTSVASTKTFVVPTTTTTTVDVYTTSVTLLPKRTVGVDYILPRHDDVAIPPFLHGFASKDISSACSCLSVPIATCTSTKTVKTTIHTTKTASYTSTTHKTTSVTATRTIRRTSTRKVTQSTTTTAVSVVTSVVSHTTTTTSTPLPTCTNFYIKASDSETEFDGEYAYPPYGIPGPNLLYFRNWDFKPLDGTTSIFSFDKATGELTADSMVVVVGYNLLQSSEVVTSVTLVDPSSYMDRLFCHGTDQLTCTASGLYTVLQLCVYDGGTYHLGIGANLHEGCAPVTLNVICIDE